MNQLQAKKKVSCLRVKILLHQHNVPANASVQNLFGREYYCLLKDFVTPPNLTKNKLKTVNLILMIVKK